MQNNNNNSYQNLGFEKAEMNLLVDKMNILLCNLHIHYQKLRNYHWNVVGSDFFDLHRIFEDEYNHVKLEIDEIAERIRAFGMKPISTLQEYLDRAEIKETTSTMSSDEMVKEVISDYHILFSFMVEVIDAAKENGDIVTDDMVTKFMKRKEKQHWMLNAFLSKQKVSASVVES